MPNFGKAKPRPKTGASKSAPKRASGFGAAAPKKPHRKGAVEPREMSGRKPDRGNNWEPKAPRTEAGRKPRHSADDRAARGTRSFFDSPRSDDRAPKREWSDKPRTGGPTYDRQEKKSWSDRPSYNDSRGSDSRGERKPASRSDRPWESRTPRTDRPSSDRPYSDRNSSDRGGRSYDRSDRPARSNSDRPWESRAPRTDRPSSDRPYADRNSSDRGARSYDRSDRTSDRPARSNSDRPWESRAPRTDRSERSGDSRGFANRSNSREFDRDRNPFREDRVSRDRSRDDSFVGARDKNPNKKAFFEDKVLDKLVSADASEVIIQGSFEEMGLHPKLVTALRGLGAETPFPIQQSTIPAALEGRDVLGRGKTGSGKTIAFAVPIISKMVAAGSVPRKPNKPRALVLAPTRELADQIDRTMSALARSVGFYTACVYGGVPQRRQEIALSRGVDILVATPGRLEDLMAQRIIDLSEVETMVIDEADHMCDLGFIEGVRRVLRATGESQKLLFSATLDREVDALVKEFMPSPYVYEVPNETQETSTIEHRVLVVDPDDRSQVLLRLVQGEGKSLIFTRTKMTAERLSESLTNNGVPAARLHGDLNQNQRTRNLERFVKGAVRVLVATDVAARGIHVDDVALVIQVDPPEEYKTYLHRSGRTGRAGKEGVVISLIPRAKRRKVEDLLRRAEREAKITDVRPGHELIEQLAGPIAPPPAAPDMLDFGDSRGGGSNHRGRDRDRDSRPKKKGNYQGSGKGRWADKPSSEKRPRAKKYSN
jgi:superfamily II DNA/RNA helicase